MADPVEESPGGLGAPEHFRRRRPDRLHQPSTPHTTGLDNSHNVPPCAASLHKTETCLSTSHMSKDDTPPNTRFKEQFENNRVQSRLKHRPGIDNLRVTEQGACGKTEETAGHPNHRETLYNYSMDSVNHINSGLSTRPLAYIIGSACSQELLASNVNGYMEYTGNNTRGLLGAWLVQHTRGYCNIFVHLSRYLPLVMLLGFVLLPGAQCLVLVPPTFNAAEMRQVSVSPTSAVCGLSGKEPFCRSSTDPATVSSCWDETCDASCPNRKDLPHSELAFNRVAGEWDQCVSKQYDGLAPSAEGAGVQAFRANFKSEGGTGSNCFLNLEQVWMAALYIQSTRSISLATWIRPVPPTRESTIFVIGTESGTDVLRIGILPNLQIFITAHNTVKTQRAKWVLPANQWTHLAIRVLVKTVSISLNGSYVSPSAYSVELGRPGTSVKYRIGQSFASDDHFVGDMQDFRIYAESLSNREVEEVYGGGLPATRIQSSCRCPASRPQILDTDPTYCVSNDGAGRPATNVFRLNRLSHPVEFVNDGKDDTAWISQPGQETATITVHLGDQFEVVNVELKFYSPFPGTIQIDQRRSMATEWLPWQYYAHDCQKEFNRPANGDLKKEDSVNCRPMIPAGGSIPYSNGKVTFSLLEGRPGNTSSLRHFLQADAVRVTMRGHPFVTDANHKYHALTEVSVDARCDCHGHGTVCDTTVTPYVCTCAKESYTKGRQCDECVDLTYKDTTKDVFAVSECKPCDCEVAGTVDGDPTCEQLGGQCRCKANVEQRRCATCRPGYFGLKASDKDGCQPCSCDTNGSKNGNTCDIITAQCTCKNHVTGKECDQCKEGYYKLESKNPDGCIPCACSRTGSTATNCDKKEGQCLCKAAVTGRDCDKCKDGFHNLIASNPAGCSPCECDAQGSKTPTCDDVTGQCKCRLNVIGRRCDQCKPGFYAKSHSDMAANGCVHLCDCIEVGSSPSAGGACADIGGQCPCKDNTIGRKCDRCKVSTYGFGQSFKTGCVSCDCQILGTLNGSDRCDVTSGQCVCKRSVRGRRCNECGPGTFGLDGSYENGCQPCDCYPPGTLEGQTCDSRTGRCLCIPGAGDPAVTDYKCTPYVTGMVPTYGPDSGGTRIEIRGGFLGNMSNAAMNVGMVPCTLMPSENNHTTLTCITGPLRMRTATPGKDTTLPITLHVTNVANVTLPDGFTYKSDPEIKHIEPLETFLMGGLKLTVTGSHLNSVYRPVMEVTVAAPDFREVFTSMCVVKTPGTMHCPTPNIQLPEGVSTDRIRKRRDLTENDQAELSMTSRGTHASRLKRASSAKPLNRETLQFFMGFVLDGVTLYRNLSNILPQYAYLKVFLNPDIHRFHEEGHIRNYRPYWPYDDNQIVIKGARMNYGCRVDDYRVTIGQVECTDLDLATNQLACKPPARQPDADPLQGSSDGIPHVTVYVGNIKQHVGWVDYEHNFWENLAFRYGIMGGLAALLIFFLLLLVCCCCRYHRRKNAEKHPHLEMAAKTGNNAYISAYNGSQTSYIHPTMEVLTLLPADLRANVMECLVDYKRIEMGKLIGQGHFARVFLGRLSDDEYSEQVPVAIKTLREYHVTPRDVTIFLEEATIMKGFKHTHVLHLVGVVIENNRAYVILPYMENGDMKTFISNEDNLLTVGELINFGLQVSDGMCYLVAQKFIHRDLAARNCMVDKDLVVKIADFGLSRDIYESDYYKDGEQSRSLPVKWMAPESLERGVYTAKSDVWSFGVLLWELMTRGCTPYPDVDSFDMKAYIMCGNRMDKPDFAPNELFLLMWHCWKLDPATRPTFNEINSQLGEILEGQNATTAMKKHHQRQVLPRSYGRNGFVLDLGRM